jgi:hypothetical protein
VPILNRRNTPGLAEGALLRYLAEAPVVPTALLPSAGVEWSAIGDRSARATLADAGLTVSMDVHFGPGGEITGGTAHRYRDVGSTGVLTPFEGRVADYRRVDRMMVPMHSEATWSLPEGPYTFWRSRVSRLQYEY